MKKPGILSSALNAIPPIHPEGFKFVLIFVLATLFAGWLWEPLFWVGLVLTLWCALFFRDPERVIKMNDKLVLSPADGRISAVIECQPPVELGLEEEMMTRISVFMNVFNCHINRAPIAGEITRIHYTPGAFINAELDKASEDNERNALAIKGKNGTIGVVQIAGLVARRIMCFAQEKDTISAGERFGLIRFGSRLDVYLPLSAKVQVYVGETAVAGETVLAQFNVRGKTQTRTRLD